MTTNAELQSELDKRLRKKRADEGDGESMSGEEREENNAEITKLQALINHGSDEQKKKYAGWLW